MDYKLKIKPSAHKDLDRIYSYIANTFEATQTAKNLLVKIRNSIKNLCNFPYKNELCDNEILRKKGYRKLIINSYIAFYTVNEQSKEVVVERVLYGATDYEKNI